jgi:uncharacterized protein with HEPN domain
MRDDRRRLLDMIEAIASIEKYTSVGKEAFLADELIRTYIVHHLQVLGEAAAVLGSSFQSPGGPLAQDSWDATCIGS